MQDDWEVNDKLTLNLGVRWDIEKNPSYLDFETPQFVLDAFNTWSNPMTGLTYAQQTRWSVRRSERRASTSTTTSAPATTAKRTRTRSSRASASAYDWAPTSNTCSSVARAAPTTAPSTTISSSSRRSSRCATADVRFNTPDHRLLRSTAPNAWPGIRRSRRDPATLVALFSRHGRRDQPHQQRPARSPTPISSASACATASATGTRAPRSRASRARTASSSRWAIATRTASSGEPTLQPWGNSPPGLAVADHRRQRHQDEEHAGAALGRETLQRGVEVGHDVGVHVHATPARTATSTSTTVRRVVDQRIPLHRIERRPEASPRRDRDVLGPLGTACSPASSRGNTHAAHHGRRACRPAAFPGGGALQSVVVYARHGRRLSARSTCR